MLLGLFAGAVVVAAIAVVVIVVERFLYCNLEMDYTTSTALLVFLYNAIGHLQAFVQCNLRLGIIRIVHGFLRLRILTVSGK